MRGNVKLRYCKIDNEVYPVSKFAALPPKERPRSICPECDQPLTLKLGTSDKVTHHAAHKSDNKSCSLTNPESAFHFNTKMYISNQLKLSNKLFLKQHCTGWNLPFVRFDQGETKRACLGQRFNKFLWLQDWDDVQVEKSIDTKRPDIVIYRDGNPIAAVEIFVTHAIDESKKALLQELGVQWVEVKAEDQLFTEYFEDEPNDDNRYSWTIGSPLMYRECFPVPEKWTCENCLTAPERFAKGQAAIDEKERLERLKTVNQRRVNEAYIQRYTDKNDNKVLWVRAFQFLRRLDNSEYAEIYVMQRDNAEPPYTREELYIKTERYSIDILYSESPVTEQSEKNINQFYRDWLELKSRGAQQVVRFCDWVSEGEFEKLKPNFKNPYKWHLVLRKWVHEDQTEFNL